jgi:glycerol kinase
MTLSQTVGIPRPEEGRYVLSVDQGTTSCRCILFDHAGTSVAVAQKEFTQYFPHPSWVEHDAREILSTQLGLVTEVQIEAGIKPESIAAIGITNQRETTVVWDKDTGEPVYHAIVWQDRRSASLIERLKVEGWSERIRAKTGLVPDPYFSATKIAWILDNVPGARERAEAGSLLFGTIDTWLVWNLTSGRVHATDYTNASRTMLFNIHTLSWDEELLELFDIPSSMLPDVRYSSDDFGLASHPSIAGSIPIRGVVGDQQGAFFGQCCFGRGMSKSTYGTGCFLLLNTGDEAVTSPSGLLTTIGTAIPGEITYALEGSVFVAGALVQWLRDELGIIASAKDTDALASSVPDTGGCYIVPAFTGLGAPWWDPQARGAVFGLTRGTNRAQFVRAALESLAYQVYDVLVTMERDAGVELSALKVDGGASANQFLMQFQADILGVDVRRPRVLETTALGAAYLAGLSVGYWTDRDDLERNWVEDARFSPAMSTSRRSQLLAGWHEAVRRTRSDI